MRYWIIEPHSDDAFLSLHTHITTVWKEIPKTIVTVFCNETRRREANTYANAVGCEHIGLMYEEGGGLSHDGGILEPMSKWPFKVGPQDKVYFPIGLQHPDHLSLREKCPSNARLYLDTPYYAKQKIAKEVIEKTRGLNIVSMLWSPKTKWRHIPLFKSQGKYFFHHPPESIPRLEIVMKRSLSYNA